MLFGACVACNSGHGSVTAYFPLAGLIYAAAGFYLFSLRRSLPLHYYQIFLAVSLAVPLVQLYFLPIEPKLCVGCLLITISAAIYSVSSLATIASKKINGFYIGRLLNGVAVVFLLFLLCRDVLVLKGIIKQEPATQEVPSITGTDWQSLSRGVASKPKTLFIITNEGCHACEEAKADLKALAVPVQIVPVCTMPRGDACFDGTGRTFPTPMLLTLAEGGKIQFQHNGWSSDPIEKSAMIQQLRDLTENESRSAPTLTSKGNNK